MALEGTLENELLSHTECFVDRKTDQQRRVGLKIRMGVGGSWVWMRSSIGLQISKVATAPDNPQILELEVCEVKNRGRRIREGRWGGWFLPIPAADFGRQLARSELVSISSCRQLPSDVSS